MQMSIGSDIVNLSSGVILMAILTTGTDFVGIWQFCVSGGLF